MAGLSSASAAVFRPAFPLEFDEIMVIIMILMIMMMMVIIDNNDFDDFELVMLKNTYSVFSFMPALVSFSASEST